MDEYLNITIHHSGEFFTEDMSVYEGGEIVDLRVDVDKWSYFELMGAIKELGYTYVENIYYMNLTARMNMLVDDKGELKITDLYRVHLSVEVFIQHTLTKTDYADETEVVLDDVSMDGVGEDDIREDGVHAVGTDDNVPMVDEVESDDIGHRAGEVDDVVRLTDDDDSSDDSTFNYDSATKVAFDDDSDEYDTELEEEEGNLINYEQVERKKGKEKCEANKEDNKESDNESDDLGSECDSDDSSRVRRKKYPIFKLQKYISNYKWEV